MSRVPENVKSLPALTVAARQVLLDALTALGDHHNAVIVVGAQAVYLRSQDADFTVAAYTSDADLALDPQQLAPAPQLDEAMQAAGFVLGQGSDGGPSPGKWLRPVDIDGDVHMIAVDLIVPTGLDGSTSKTRRSATIPPHSRGVAMRASGLEVAVVDYDPMTITSLEPERDTRSLTVNVAGVAALLTAKAHKIDDRLRDAGTGRTHRLNDKDAGDVARLMITSNARTVRAALQRAFTDPAIAPIARKGLDLLHTQFGARHAPGIQMATRALVGALDPATITEICVAYTRALSRN